MLKIDRDPRGSIRRIKIVLWIALIPPENAYSPIFDENTFRKNEKIRKIQPHVPFKGTTAGDKSEGIAHRTHTTSNSVVVLLLIFVVAAAVVVVIALL